MAMASNTTGQESDRTAIKSKVQSTNCNMERLPREIFFDILSRQSISSVLECKLVSRQWHTAVKDPVLANKHLTLASKDNPWLIVFSDWPKSKLQLVQLTNTVLEGYTEAIKTLNLTPLESFLPDFEVVGSCNGLVCLYDYIFDDPLYTINPFTTEFRMLPRLAVHLERTICRVVFGFGFCPRGNDYKAIKIVYYKMGNIDFVGGDPEGFVFRFGSPTWRHLGKIPYMLSGPASEAEVNGKLHWLTHCIELQGTRYCDIVSFDLETEDFQVVPRPNCGGLNKTDYHLVALRGCLSAVVPINEGSNEIWVMKEYGVQATWTKEFVVGNYEPQGYRMDMAPPFRRKKNGSNRRGFQVLCVLKNGEILYVYRSRSLVSYNPDSGEFRDLNFLGLPLEFQAVVHVGSLVSPNRVI